MSQLVKLIDKPLPLETALSKCSRSYSSNIPFDSNISSSNLASSYLRAFNKTSEPHAQVDSTKQVAEKKKRKSSPSVRSFKPNRNKLNTRSFSQSSESGCSVCENKVKRSLSRSQSSDARRINHKNPNFFLNELLNNTKNQSAQTTKNLGSHDFFEDSTSQTNLFDRYLVISILYLNSDRLKIYFPDLFSKLIKYQ